MKKVFVIQHDPHDGPGSVVEVLAARKIGVELIRPFVGEKIPHDLNPVCGLVVLGGPMGVNDQDVHPYLADEMSLIRVAVDVGKPVLGLCLGSQLLAAAMGASVKANPVKEVGWHPVVWNDKGSSDSLFRGLQPSFQAFHWHGDTFDLPTGSVNLASSPLCRHQAFRHGATAYGVQFHLEVDRAKVSEMVAVFGHRLQEVGVEGSQVLLDADKYLPELQAVAEAAVERWADLLN